MTSVLEVRSLEKRFGGVYAAKGISVSFATGEVVGIIGANGAGKTTFVNLITGHLTPSAGSILLEGEEVVGLSPREMSQLGVSRSFQVPQLFPTLSIRENLLMALAINDSRSQGAFGELRRRDRFDHADELAKLYGIVGYSHRVVASVPQGVRKLLDIAMASVGEAKVLFLDEPTSGVSMQDRDDLMRNVLHNARKTGTTLLVIEHDMEIIRRFVNRVIAFYQGEIICDGPPDEALEHEEVRKYVLGGNLPKHVSSRGHRHA